MSQKILVLAAAVAAGVAGTAFAAATLEEVKSLGTTRMPWGAERAGNKAGTIPEWTGPASPPPSFNPKNPEYRPDPYANEKPLFSIDAKNMEQHAEKLTEGIKSMLKKYPGYRLDIYPSHRTANYPKLYTENAIKNATNCKTTDSGLRLEGCWAGTPFPFPKTGNEVMWNRLFKYDNYSMQSKLNSAYVVDARGNAILSATSTYWAYYPIFNPKRTTPVGSDEVYYKIRMDYRGPSRKAGEKLVLHDSVDMVNVGRRAWQYLPGQRRVKLSPDLAYDTPSPGSGGTSVVDDSAIFYGALDRFDFKLIGKKEMYIPYNAYKINDPKACPNELAFSKSYLNPDCMRWELHRVWVVEAKVKAGLRHVYPKRTFYWDEDLPGVGLSDNYDAIGQVYRVAHSIPVTFYEAPGQGHSTDQTVVYDLATGSYSRQVTTTTPGWLPVPPQPETFFTADALAAEGVR